MFKLLTIAVAATTIGAATTAAHACGCSCPSKSTAASAPEKAPAEAAPEKAPKSAAQTPSTNPTERRYSYEPSMAPSPRYVSPARRSSRSTATSGFSIDVGRRAKGY